MNLLREYWPHIGTAGVGGGAIWLIFRDEFKKWREDRRADRIADRAERVAAAGKGDKTWEKLFELLAADLKAQRENDGKIVLVLEGVKDLLSRLESKQNEQGKQLDMIHQRAISIQGAVGRVQ